MISKAPKLELSGSPPKRSVQILYSLALLGTIYALFGWILAKYSLSGLEIVLFLSLILQGVGSFLGTDQYKYIDFETRTLVQKKWYSFMGFGEGNAPLSAFREVVVEQSCPASAASEANFIGRVGFAPASGGPLLWVKDFPGSNDERPAEPEKFARELAGLTGLPYFVNIVSKERV